MSVCTCTCKYVAVFLFNEGGAVWKTYCDPRSYAQN